MKKRGFGGGGMSGGQQMGLMKQFQKMQQDMAEAQEALATATTEVTVGGAITITITGHQRVQAIQIKPEALDTSDPEWVNDLQDMLVIAVNKAIEESQAMAAKRMEEITGGLGDNPLLSGLLGG